MDSAVLVTDGHKLIRALDEAGTPPRFAMWVHNSEADAWRLWIVPPAEVTDDREFYRQIASVASKLQGELSVFDPGDVDLRKADHPAVKGMSAILRMEGLGNAQFFDTTFNGFFLPNSIALRISL